MAEPGTEVKSCQNRKLDKRVTVVGSGLARVILCILSGLSGIEGHGSGWCNRAGGALVGLSDKKLESQILEDEISRLIRIADIHLETGAVFDFNRPNSLSNPDLIILDPTGSFERVRCICRRGPFQSLC